MDTASATTLEFSLAAAHAGERVDVRLRGDGERWVVVASGRSGSRTAIAPTARLALAEALAFLPPATVRALLADLALYGPSAELARLAIRSA